MNNKGFTLIELTMGTAIAAVVALALSSLLAWAVIEFEGVKRRLQAQSEALRAELMLRRYMSTAIKLKGIDLSSTGNVNLLNGGNPSYAEDAQGRLAADFNYTQLSDWPVGGWQNVALYFRDWKEPVITGGANTRRSDMIATSIVVRAPTSTTAGVMFIGSVGSNGSGGSMTPNYGDQWVGGITEFSMDKKIKGPPDTADQVQHTVPGPGPTYFDSRVVSVLISFKLRYHFASSLPKIWCPTADILAATAGCTGGAGYADIERSVRIVFANNNIGTRDDFGAGNEWVEDRPLGYLHFFRPILPNVWEN